MRNCLLSITVLMCLVALMGCSSSEGAYENSARIPGTTSVTLGGAQDIAHFRSIVDEGQVPEPSTLEPVGFFAEHGVDLPDADCGDRVCVHPLLAVAPGIDGVSNWSMAYVGLNSPVVADELQRAPLHLVLVTEINTLGSWNGIEYLDALNELFGGLRTDDRVSVIQINESAHVRYEARPALEAHANTTELALGAQRAGDERVPVAIYDGLARAAQVIEDNAEAGGASRIVMLTRGRADAGITDSGLIIELAASIARTGTAISVVGYGEDYSRDLPVQLSEVGGGSYGFAQNGADLEEIFRIEASTALHPLATDMQLQITAAPGYRIGRIYGARSAWTDQAGAHLNSPALMLGQRTSATDVSEGRRGGGGGLFVELLADAEAGASIGADSPAFAASYTYVDAESGDPVEREVSVNNTMAPGENPNGMFPQFSDPARGKAFMMLNMYLSLQMATELFHSGDCDGALGIRVALEPTYEGWQDEYEDPDIDADWALLTSLDTNMRAQCGAAEPRTPQGSMGCFSD